MITASISDSSISIVGHASQQVCSAVSCLTQTLDLILKKYGIEHYFFCESGNTQISCKSNNNIVNIAFDFVGTGLKDIAISYPSQLQTNQNN